MAGRPRTLLVASLMVVALLLPSDVSLAEGQDSVVYRQGVERLFQDALRLFNEKRFLLAEAGFLRIVNAPELTHRTSAAYLMAAKAMYHRSAYRTSADLLTSFLARFKGSAYVDDAQYTLALDLYQTERLNESAELLLSVAEASTDSQLAAQAESMLRIVANSELAISQLRSLLNKTRTTGTRAGVALALAEKVFRTGDAKGAREVLRPVLALPPGDARRADAEALSQRIDRSGAVKIGVILPLTIKADQSTAQGVGEQMLNGIKLATDEHNQEAMPKVTLEVRDSERDAGVAAREVSLLSSENEILALIGPVFSNEVFASAGLAAAKGIPLITPTATAPGIASIGPSIFQANPDYEVRGRAMAKYAVELLGARKGAVLSANDTMNKMMTAAFIREMRARGAEIVGSEWYLPGQTDLRDELARLRQRGMELTEPITVNFSQKLRPQDIKKMVEFGVPQQVIDSLTGAGASASVEFLFGPRGTRVADSLKIPTQRVKAKYDSLNYPVTGIDVMFVPIAGPEEIGIVSSQLRYFNFQTQLLGNGNWNDPVQLEQSRQYANGVIFGLDTYWEESDPQVLQFRQQFRSRFSRDPDANAMIGYDAMKLLLRAVRQGATRREEVVSALSAARPLNGIHSRIILGPNRVNSTLTLLQYKGRAIRRIGEIDVNPFPHP